MPKPADPRPSITNNVTTARAITSTPWWLVTSLKSTNYPQNRSSQDYQKDVRSVGNNLFQSKNKALSSGSKTPEMQERSLQTGNNSTIKTGLTPLPTIQSLESGNCWKSYTLETL